MRKLELLAPAGNKDIGIAAIDCGADAVYMAGPSFGAREAAGNSVSDIADVCRYAHIFGVKIFATVNTLLKDNELERARKMMWELHEASVDAFIVQDMRLLALDLPPVELHASTQTVIRTPEQARLLESYGFTRLVLERQLSLEAIKEIRKAVGCELEFFIHGALCVSYSGQCFLSQYLTGRSANRGCCAQPCRSRYDLTDKEGNILLQNSNILSLKDFRLDTHIDELAGAGISSFKIEGRLKNASYVKNVVRHYSGILDRFIALHPDFSRTSYGNVTGGFTPDPDITFNRGYTEAFIEGKRGKWNSGEAAKSTGEYLGAIRSVKGRTITIGTSKRLSNGDGLLFTSADGESTGARAETAQGSTVTLREKYPLKEGMKVYRNLNVAFEKELERNMPQRIIDVDVHYQSLGGKTVFKAECGDGRKAEISMDETAQIAQKEEAARESLSSNISKLSGHFRFNLKSLESDVTCFYPISFINEIRRRLASELEKQLLVSAPHPHIRVNAENVLTSLDIQPELMRTKYCIKNELGLCPKQQPSRHISEPLFLVNSGYRLKLEFDCKKCEMIVTL